MASFASFMSSLSGQPIPPQAAGSPSASGSTSSGQAANKPRPVQNAPKLAPNNAAAGIKRKSEEPPSGLASKIAKVGQQVAAQRPTPSGTSSSPAPKAASTSGTASAAPFRGTARPSAPLRSQSAASKPVSQSIAATSSSVASPAKDGAKPLRGFAAMMAKAQEGYQATVAAGVSGIKHKPVEKISRRDRERLKQKGLTAKQKGAKGGVDPKGGRAMGAPPEAKGAPGKKKADETSYKGTMKKPAPAPLAYSGTMRKVDPSAPRPKPVKKRGEGQDKYGGYASWSDLDDAEDDEEDDEGANDYDSEASSDMEGGFDDMEREEAAGLRAAKKEDQEALEEEERHKREKLERKRKLEQLSKSAAARSKKY